MAGWWVSRGGRTRRPREEFDPAISGRGYADRQRLSLARQMLIRVPYALLLLGLVWLTAYLLFSPEFSIGSPDVVGARMASQEDVVRAAGLTGKNVFLVNAEQAQRAVDTLPIVKSTFVTIEWPNRAAIVVSEYSTFLTWKTGSAAYLVNEVGEVMATSRGEQTPLSVVDLDNTPVAIGQFVDSGTLDAAAGLAASLPAAGFHTVGFERSTALGTVAVLDGGLRVAFGDPDELDQKVQDLRALEPAVSRNRLTFVDVRLADRPFVR